MPLSNQILAPTNGNDQIMSDYFEKSIAAIENKDAVSFHELFSEEARKEKAAELLTEIEFILDFYQGKMVTYDFNIGHTENEYSSDGSTCILHGCCNIKASM